VILYPSHVESITIFKMNVIVLLFRFMLWPFFVYNRSKLVAHLHIDLKGNWGKVVLVKSMLAAEFHLQLQVKGLLVQMH
jgi:hypothetical protein